jgi:hypothetical protein
MMLETKNLGILLFALTMTTTFSLSQSEKKFGIMVEGGATWQSRNDIRVPNETGTEFSLPDVIGAGPYGVFRAEFDFDINERHGLRFVFAPLEITDNGTLPEDVSFAGEEFEPGVQTEANYKFSSYRISYRYRFYNGPTWRWKVGATGFIRDARIALNQDGKYAEDTDLGFVPLVHLQGLARIGEGWRFILDFDGLAASQGRAFDISAKLGYSVSDLVEIAFGYRVIEGGADVEQVYNFAWFNSIVGSVRFAF